MRPVPQSELLAECLADGGKLFIIAITEAFEARLQQAAGHAFCNNMVRRYVHAWVDEHGEPALKEIVCEFMLAKVPFDASDVHVEDSPDENGMRLRIKELHYHARKGKVALRKFVDLLPREEMLNTLGGLLCGEVIKQAVQDGLTATE